MGHKPDCLPWISPSFAKNIGLGWQAELSKVHMQAFKPSFSTTCIAFFLLRCQAQRTLACQETMCIASSLDSASLQNSFWLTHPRAVTSLGLSSAMPRTITREPFGHVRCQNRAAPPKWAFSLSTQGFPLLSLLVFLLVPLKTNLTRNPLKTETRVAQFAHEKLGLKEPDPMSRRYFHVPFQPKPATSPPPPKQKEQNLS